MPQAPRIIPIPCPFGTGSVVYVYYLDTPEPALVDTGVAASPDGVIEPALAAAGFRLGDVRWILATHGHFDHVGAAHAMKQRADATVAIHAADANLLRDRQAHLEGYAGARYRYLDDPEILAQAGAMLMENISGELAADRELSDGDRVSLGGGVSVSVIHTPGHSPGSATFVLDGLGWAFTGDAVQVSGSSGNRFPLFVDPIGYRTSLDRLLSVVRPSRMLMGHRFLDPATRQPLEAQVEGDGVAAALRASLELETRIAAAAAQIAPPVETAAAFAPAAELLGYPPDDPTRWPPSFFATLGGYIP